MALCPYFEFSAPPLKVRPYDAGPRHNGFQVFQVGPFESGLLQLKVGLSLVGQVGRRGLQQRVGVSISDFIRQLVLKAFQGLPR
jgi:hypothetical protein